MSDDDVERLECPEWACPHRFRPAELRAHLEWDHNRSDHRARRMVERLREKEGDR